MREIKFRAWGKSLEMMVDVEVLYVWGDIKPKMFGDAWEKGTFELMQYTGLKDKNGKECYEGDIVLRHEHNDHCEIVYRDEWGAFAFKGKTKISVGFSHLYGGHSVHPWEIIGNIYSNPELLK